MDTLKVFFENVESYNVKDVNFFRYIYGLSF